MTLQNWGMTLLLWVMTPMFKCHADSRNESTQAASHVKSNMISRFDELMTCILKIDGLLRNPWQDRQKRGRCKPQSVGHFA